MPYEQKTWLTLPSGSSDGSGAQADPNDSLGKWRSTTEMSLTIGNLWTQLSLSQLSSSTTYRTVVLTNANITDTLEECRVMTDSVTLVANMSVEFAVVGFDDLTASDFAADEDTAPTLVTFFTPYQATGTAGTDWGLAKKIGPINTYTNTTDLTADEDLRIFLFIKLICAGVDAGAFNGTNNKIGIQVVGANA